VLKTIPQEKIAVLGLGAWGTAIAHHLSSKTNLEVVGWSRNNSIVKEINEKSKNSVYFADTLLSNRFVATSSLNEAITGVKYVFFALPSNSLDSIIPLLSAHPLSGSVLISGIKGLCTGGKTVLQLFNYFYSAKKLSLAVLSGPCFACDLVNQVPLSLVSASFDPKIANRVASLFSNSIMRVYESTDVLGVELGGILKNIIAVAAGISDGLGLGVSTRAALITRGLAEMQRFSENLGAKKETLFGLSGLGDLVMTATSDQSRNRMFGVLVGRGASLAELNARNITVEALNSLPQVTTLAAERNVEMPIAETLLKLLGGKISPKEAVSYLIERPQKSEF
jgi:glycerol-3-phosphate dehydrogenase (NAD(P)+)